MEEHWKSLSPTTAQLGFCRERQTFGTQNAKKDIASWPQVTIMCSCRKRQGRENRELLRGWESFIPCDLAQPNLVQMTDVRKAPVKGKFEEHSLPQRQMMRRELNSGRTSLLQQSYPGREAVAVCCLTSGKVRKAVRGSGTQHHLSCRVVLKLLK